MKKLIGVLLIGMWSIALPVYGFQRGGLPEDIIELAKKRITIRGNVINAKTLRPIARAFVRLRTEQDFIVLSNYSDGQGVFEFENIRRGKYFIEVSQDGYKTTRQEILLTIFSITFQRVSIMLSPRELVSRPGESKKGKSVTVEELMVPPKAQQEFEKGLLEFNENEQFEKAVKHFRKAIEIYSDYDDAYNQLALVYLLQEQIEDAQKVLQEALTVNAENSRAHALLGVSYRNRQQYEESVTPLRKAVALDPEDALSQKELAKSLLALKKNAEALAHAEKSHELNPAPADIHLVLYTALVRQKEYEKALAELDEFLIGYPENPRVAEIQEQKKQLSSYLASRKQ